MILAFSLRRLRVALLTFDIGIEYHDVHTGVNTQCSHPRSAHAPCVEDPVLRQPVMVKIKYLGGLLEVARDKRLSTISYMRLRFRYSRLHRRYLSGHWQCDFGSLSFKK